MWSTLSPKVGLFSVTIASDQLRSLPFYADWLVLQVDRSLWLLVTFGVWEGWWCLDSRRFCLHPAGIQDNIVSIHNKGEITAVTMHVAYVWGDRTHPWGTPARYAWNKLVRQKSWRPTCVANVFFIRVLNDHTQSWCEKPAIIERGATQILPTFLPPPTWPKATWSGHAFSGWWFGKVTNIVRCSARQKGARGRGLRLCSFLSIPNVLGMQTRWGA